jgi:hypothetical protein
MPIDLEWKPLPKGQYDAIIHELEYRFGIILSIIIVWRVLHEGREYFLDDWLVLDAPKTSSSYQRTAEGKGRIMQILAAYGEKMPAKMEPDELDAALVGKALRIVVTHKIINDLPVPKVAGILGKAKISTDTP